MTFFLSHINGQTEPYAVDLAGLHAHGWDPLMPTDSGVYDGLHGEPRYLSEGIESGVNLLCMNWVGMWGGGEAL